MRSIRWTLATVGGYVLGGVVFHSPGSSGVGATLYDWDPVAAVFGAILGGIVGVITGVLQSVALGGRSWRLIAASVVAVAVAHALADGAPAIWGVGLVAAVSGLCATAALAWALRTRAWLWIIASALAWWAGWSLGVASALVLGLSGGSRPEVWAMEHAVIAATLGLAWGAVTSPDARRVLEENERRVMVARAPRRGDH